MSEATSTAKFFGVNLSSLRKDFEAAWRGLFQLPALRWLVPSIEVQLVFPSGARGLAVGGDRPALPDSGRARAAKYVAVVLPEDILLRRTLTLPLLSASELHAAVALDVSAMSPFAEGDCAWVFGVAAAQRGACEVDIALTSKLRVNQHIKNASLPVSGQPPEVWVARSEGRGFLAFPEYRNTHEIKTEKRLGWVVGILVFVAMALVSAIAMSATLQLYLRAADARARWTQLQQTVSPLSAARESLLKNSEQLTKLDKIVGPQTPILEVLKSITDALPDETALTSLKIRANKIVMVGQTPDTAALMKHLSAIPTLGDVKAPVPATKPLGAAKEQFTLEAAVLTPKPTTNPAAKP